MRVLAIVLVCIFSAVACRGGGATTASACHGTEAELVGETGLLVAADLARPPFAFRDGREITGFEVDLLRAVGRKLSHEARFVDRASPGLYPAILAEQADVAASALRTTPEAMEQICFTDPVLPGALAVVVHGAHTPEGDGLDTVTGGRVVVAEGSAAGSWAQRELVGVASEVATTPTLDDAFAELGAGLARAVVTDLPTALYRRTKEDHKLRIVDTVERDDPFAWGVRPDNGALAAAINEVLAGRHRDGTYAELYEPWFGEDPPDG